jgi:hypothetical protein
LKQILLPKAARQGLTGMGASPPLDHGQEILKNWPEFDPDQRITPY